jgi:hypothetical protein
LRSADSVWLADEATLQLLKKNRRESGVSYKPRAQRMLCRIRAARFPQKPLLLTSHFRFAHVTVNA